MAPVISVTAGAVRITVRVQPRSAHNRVLGVQGGALKVQVTAPPIDGEANRALVALLAEWVGVPRRSIAVTRGQAARDKLVEVASDDPEALARAIAARVDMPGRPD
jgi:uncharacterized protein (TIGR00251 family)